MSAENAKNEMPTQAATATATWDMEQFLAPSEVDARVVELIEKERLEEEAAAIEAEKLEKEKAFANRPIEPNEAGEYEFMIPAMETVHEQFIAQHKKNATMIVGSIVAGATGAVMVTSAQFSFASGAEILGGVFTVLGGVGLFGGLAALAYAFYRNKPNSKFIEEVNLPKSIKKGLGKAGFELLFNARQEPGREQSFPLQTDGAPATGKLRYDDSLNKFFVRAD